MADYIEREYWEEHGSVIKNCNIGRAICVVVSEEGKPTISINETPITPDTDSKELREFMLKTALSWLDQLETIPLHGAENDNSEESKTNQ